MLLWWLWWFRVDDDVSAVSAGPAPDTAGCCYSKNLSQTAISTGTFCGRTLKILAHSPAPWQLHGGPASEGRGWKKAGRREERKGREMMERLVWMDESELSAEGPPKKSRQNTCKVNAAIATIKYTLLWTPNMATKPKKMRIKKETLNVYILSSKYISQ